MCVQILVGYLAAATLSNYPGKLLLSGGFRLIKTSKAAQIDTTVRAETA